MNVHDLPGAPLLHERKCITPVRRRDDQLQIVSGEKPEDVQGELQRLAGPGAEVQMRGEAYPSDALPLRADVLAAVRKAVTAGYPEVPVVPSMLAGTSDGLFFSAAGIPAYGTGEGFMKESDDFTHGLNERIRWRASTRD